MTKHIIEKIKNPEELNGNDNNDSWLLLIYDDETNKMKWQAFIYETIEGYDNLNGVKNENKKMKNKEDIKKEVEFLEMLEREHNNKKRLESIRLRIAFLIKELEK